MVLFGGLELVAGAAFFGGGCAACREAPADRERRRRSRVAEIVTRTRVRLMREGDRAASRRLRRGRVAHARALRAGNYWLAFFGKWTLADVLVMTCLLGPLSAPRPASAAKTRLP